MAEEHIYPAKPTLDTWIVNDLHDEGSDNYYGFTFSNLAKYLLNGYEVNLKADTLVEVLATRARRNGEPLRVLDVMGEALFPSSWWPHIAEATSLSYTTRHADLDIPGYHRQNFTGDAYNDDTWEAIPRENDIAFLRPVGPFDWAKICRNRFMADDPINYIPPFIDLYSQIINTLKIGGTLFAELPRLPFETELFKEYILLVSSGTNLEIYYDTDAPITAVSLPEWPDIPYHTGHLVAVTKLSEEIDIPYPDCY